MKFLKDILETTGYMTPGREQASLKLRPNPFSVSKITQEMYHGSHSKDIQKFRRPSEGVWFADHPEWVQELYTDDGKGDVVACWVNVKNPYTPTARENEQYYGEMDIIGEFFNKLKAAGYDSYIQGGESGSIAVFDSVQIMNAYNGKEM